MPKGSQCPREVPGCTPFYGRREETGLKWDSGSPTLVPDLSRWPWAKTQRRSGTGWSLTDRRPRYVGPAAVGEQWRRCSFVEEAASSPGNFSSQQRPRWALLQNSSLPKCVQAVTATMKSRKRRKRRRSTSFNRRKLCSVKYWERRSQQTLSTRTTRFDIGIYVLLIKLWSYRRCHVHTVACCMLASQTWPWLFAPP